MAGTYAMKQVMVFQSFITLSKLGLEHEHDRHEYTVLGMILPLCTLRTIQPGTKCMELKTAIYNAQVYPISALNTHAVVHILAIRSLLAAPAPLPALAPPSGSHHQDCPQAPLWTDPPA